MSIGTAAAKNKYVGGLGHEERGNGRKLAQASLPVSKAEAIKRYRRWNKDNEAGKADMAILDSDSGGYYSDEP